MPSKTGKAPADYYKSDVSVDQSTNTGFDSTTRSIISGDGAKSAMSASDDVLSVQPINDDTTGTFLVKDKGGNNIFAVDTVGTGTGSTATGRILMGRSQVAANTQYAYFGTDNNASSVLAADIHYAIPFVTNQSSAVTISFGSATSSSFNDTNPSTSVSLTQSANTYTTYYWYVMDNITIDAVVWLHGADNATGEATAAHLMAYTVDIDNGSTSGDLSAGVVVADGATITNAGWEQIYYQSMTVQSADVDAGKVILFTFASDTANSDYSINATVKYHIR
jgi:hypothetical protein